MTTLTAEMAKKTAEKHPAHALSDENSAEKSSLGCRYGQIGIPAVAAAARYQGGANHPAKAPAPAWRRSYSG
ncbi:MAG: hypothetical protein ABSE22_13455 [Xanthobacteraceae bacterium]|jgi:hypothetical protein